MDGQQQQYENSKKISDLIEKLNKWLEKTNESLKYNSMEVEENETNKEIKHSIEQLNDSLDKMVEEGAKMYNLPEIERAHAFMTLYYNKYEESVQSGFTSLTTDIYGKYGSIECHSNIHDSRDKIKCANYRDKGLELPDSIYLLESIKKPILNICDKILYPINNRYKPYMDITAEIYMDSREPIKDNQEIEMSIDNGFVRYNNGRFKTMINCSPYTK
jgi:hypothetical protein